MVVILVGTFLYASGIVLQRAAATPLPTEPSASSPAAEPTTTRVPRITPGAEPTSVVPTPASSRTPFHVYLPVVGGEAPSTSTPVPATPTAVPAAVATLAPSVTPPPPPPTPIPTRGPIRITKLGLGVYDSGGGMLPAIDESRPSVILLMDPSVDFAKEVRQHFPKAFIVGRIFATSQPLDNPTQRGTAFADQVAVSAVPLKGIVDAWMSYNEVANGDDPANLTAYNTFQVAFAHRLQDYYGIAAVAGNDGPRSVRADEYPQYFADAIRASRYFGVHSYPDANVKSLRDPSATDQVLYYRQIHAALEAAGIKSGPFIITEIGLYNGWRDVTTDTSMAEDFTWVADQMNNDPYVLGMTIFGLFGPDRSQWSKFNIDGSDIPRIIGDYNTVH